MNTLLFQRFNLKRPIKIEDIKKGHEICALPDKTIIRSDAESLEHDLVELLAHAKLAETDNLLVTFFYQRELSERESRFASMFFQLCQPLQDAWVWGLMRRIVPDIYEKEVAESYEMWEQVHDRLFLKNKGPVKIDDPDFRRQMFGMWAILYENPENKVDIRLLTSTENRQVWQDYMNALEEFIRKKPNVSCYLKLPVITQAPYIVRLAIDETGFRHFEIKEKLPKNYPNDRVF